MSSIRNPATIQSTNQRFSTLLFVLLVSTSLIVGAVGTAAAGTASTPAALSADDDGPLVDDSDAVDNSTIVVNEDGNVVSGKKVSYGDPVGKVIRVYSINGADKTDPLVARGDNVATRTGQNVIVDSGSVAIFDESPDIRARYENGTVEKVVVNGSNIETESGVNVKTEDGDNVEINRDTFNDHEFVVDILNTTNVGEGETMNITAEVGNIGHTSGEEVIEVSVDGRSYHPQMVELDPGETGEIDLKYPTWSGDAPEVELTVETPDDSSTVTVPVEKPDFRVDIQDSDFAVSNGETITVPVTVDRTGGATGRTYAIDFLVDGTAIDTELVSLNGGGETDLEFSYETGDEDVPTVLATVAGPSGANASQEIPVREPILAVNQVHTPENITEYEQVDVTATLENYGTDTKNQTVQLAVSKNGTNTTTVVDETRAEVGNRSAKNVTFTYHTKPDYHPEHELIVQTPDHNRTVQVETDPQAVYQFASAPEGNLTAPPGSEYSLAPTIENAGHTTGTVNISLQVNGSVEQTQNISTGTNSSQSVEFPVNVPSNSSVTYKIATQHDNTSGAIFPQGSDAIVGNETTADGGQVNGTSTATENNGNGGGGGLFGFSLPPLPIIITTAFSVLLVGIIAHVAS